MVGSPLRGDRRQGGRRQETEDMEEGRGGDEWEGHDEETPPFICPRPDSISIFSDLVQAEVHVSALRGRG